MVVMVFANASTLSTLILIYETFSIRSNSLYTFKATKQMHIWASMRLRVKWNMGRISIFDLAIRKARSTCQRLWYAVYTSCIGISVLVRYASLTRFSISSSLYATPIVASSFILPPIFSTTITQILPDGYFFLRTNIVKIPFVSPNIRWHKDTKYCLSTSYKIRDFWVTKSGKKEHQISLSGFMWWEVYMKSY